MADVPSPSQWISLFEPISKCQLPFSPVLSLRNIILYIPIRRYPCARNYWWNSRGMSIALAWRKCCTVNTRILHVITTESVGYGPEDISHTVEKECKSYWFRLYRGGEGRGAGDTSDGLFDDSYIIVIQNNVDRVELVGWSISVAFILQPFGLIRS